MFVDIGEQLFGRIYLFPAKFKLSLPPILADFVNGLEGGNSSTYNSNCATNDLEKFRQQVDHFFSRILLSSSLCRRPTYD